ncbi:MAG: hypothetical protein JWM25_1613 [Thermoleophilia bacterium]|nr:hypothetical protein [Thermoleophilia bacterium]MCZ4497028.1 hypothetical protein [Thermoleophilia bacterium]
MQIDTGMDRRDMRTTAGGAVGLRALPDANRGLGEFRIRFLDRDDHVTFTTHQAAVAGGRAGAREGYATLRDAIAALTTATAGDIPAAVVMERSGRYFGHQLKARDLERGFRAPLLPLHLETDERAAVMELRATNRMERVRAFVDGSWVHRFRA